MFKDHPNLIQGFNAFLPSCYKIDCTKNSTNPETSNYTNQNESTFKNQNKNYTLLSDNINLQKNNGSIRIEFSHAISYVNKVKTRFINQPEIYNEFLEILQSYQSEKNSLSEVHEKVKALFVRSADLLNEFKQFLPDNMNYTAHNQEQTEEYENDDQKNLTNQSQKFTKNFNHNYNNLQLECLNSNESQFYNNIAPYTKNQFIYKKNDSDLNAHDNYNQNVQISNIRSSLQDLNNSKTQKNLNYKNLGYTSTSNSKFPESVNSYTNPKNLSLLDELNFFDKIKKAIGNKQTYNDFLKVLNLFSLEIIDKKTLVENVKGFINDSHQDLFNWFKVFVEYEEKPQCLENILFKKHQINLSLCKAFGPSYRQLPNSEILMPSSGRDELCWEVLNDELVGHPTWASEDSGFISHRKNQYEEILFKIEEERLEYDFYMESNLRTIQILESIANRIANMTPEQKLNFKLPPGLGHNSTTIYKRVIRKVYTKERGFEVIDALHENPTVAVPIVLKRLKQKDEEWRRARREWNKVWREMEQKVFYKSLDHLGLTFKQADKKMLAAKYLVAEINTLKIEQQSKRFYPLITFSQDQLTYSFKDFSILFDIIWLTNIFVNKSSKYLVNDKEKFINFFISFISLFFAIEEEKVKQFLDSKNTNEKINANNITKSNNKQTNLKKRNSDTDYFNNDYSNPVSKLQNKKLESQNELKDEIKNDISTSSNTSDSFGELWIKTNSNIINSSTEETQKEPRSIYNFFCNTTAYVFFRHLLSLYERLEEIKSMENTVSKDLKNFKYSQFAKDLSLLSHQLEDMGIKIVPTSSCYLQVLELCKKLLDGDIEHQWFEEVLRQDYRNKAYKLYTIDKVIQGIVKHGFSMISDPKVLEILSLFRSNRNKSFVTTKDQILYRMRVRSLMSPDENMFKISYNFINNTLGIQFFNLHDLTINNHKNPKEEYNYYVTNYIISHPTEGVPVQSVFISFSKKYIEKVKEYQYDGEYVSKLVISICKKSYRLFFEANTYDEYTSKYIYARKHQNNKHNSDELASLKHFVQSNQTGWKSTLNDNDDHKFFEKRIQILFEKGVEDYNSYLDDKKKDLNLTRNTSKKIKLESTE